MKVEGLAPVIELRPTNKKATPNLQTKINSQTQVIELRPTNRDATPNLQTRKSETIITIEGRRFKEVGGVTYRSKSELKEPDSILHSFEEITEGKGKKLNIVVLEFGLDKPSSEDPIALRIDHGCICMELPQLKGHDCAKQRDIAMEAMHQMGRGMMVFVNPEASTGMGHGISVAMKYLQKYQEAERNGTEHKVTIKGNLEEEGIDKFDVRQHEVIAKLISRLLKAVSNGKNKPKVVLLGSSPSKFDSLVNGDSIDIVGTAQVIALHGTDASKKQNGYKQSENVKKDGVYVEVTTSSGKKLIPITEVSPDYWTKQPAQKQPITMQAGVNYPLAAAA